MQVLRLGCGHERAADERCPATTSRRRRDEWIADEVMESVRLLAPAAHDRMIGLEPDRLNADGCSTKAPSGGECTGKSPVGRAEPGLKRPQSTGGTGIPLTTGPARAGARDHTLPPAALDQDLGLLPKHPRPAPDAGYDYRIVHDDLAGRRIDAHIAPRGAKTPTRTGGRWAVERPSSSPSPRPPPSSRSAA